MEGQESIRCPPMRRRYEFDNKLNNEISLGKINYYSWKNSQRHDNSWCWKPSTWDFSNGSLDRALDNSTPKKVVIVNDVKKIGSGRFPFSDSRKKRRFLNRKQSKVNKKEEEYVQYEENSNFVWPCQTNFEQTDGFQKFIDQPMNCLSSPYEEDSAMSTDVNCEPLLPRSFIIRQDEDIPPRFRKKAREQLKMLQKDPATPNQTSSERRPQSNKSSHCNNQNFERSVMNPEEKGWEYKEERQRPRSFHDMTHRNFNGQSFERPLNKQWSRNINKSEQNIPLSAYVAATSLMQRRRNKFNMSGANHSFNAGNTLNNDVYDAYRLDPISEMDIANAGTVTRNRSFNKQASRKANSRWSMINFKGNDEFWEDDFTKHNNLMGSPTKDNGYVDVSIGTDDDQFIDKSDPMDDDAINETLEKLEKELQLEDISDIDELLKCSSSSSFNDSKDVTKVYKTKDFLNWARIYFNSHLKRKIDPKVLDWISRKHPLSLNDHVITQNNDTLEEMDEEECLETELRDKLVLPPTDNYSSSHVNIPTHSVAAT